MSKKTQGRTTATQWLIRILILIIFCVAVIIAARNFMEINQLRQRVEQMEEQIGEHEQPPAADQD